LQAASLCCGAGFRRCSRSGHCATRLERGTHVKPVQMRSKLRFGLFDAATRPANPPMRGAGLQQTVERFDRAVGNALGERCVFFNLEYVCMLVTCSSSINKMPRLAWALDGYS
jgi:hypothetical protein